MWDFSKHVLNLYSHICNQLPLLLKLLTFNVFMVELLAFLLFKWGTTGSNLSWDAG